MRASRKPRGGFTLLEVLLAATLSSVLLLSLWSLLGIYSELFETARAKTEQAQLARALLQQMSDDLRGAIQDTAVRPRLKSVQGAVARDAIDDNTDDNIDDELEPPSPLSWSSSVRRFGLFGSQHELRFDVLQVTQAALSRAVDDETAEDRPIVARAPELRTVHYWFEQLRDVDESAVDEPAEDDGETHPGLMRREFDFETRRTDENGSTGDTGISPVLEPGALARRQCHPEDDEGLTWVPEVVALEFRYYDGQGWRSSWNSLEQKSLPVAVEISMKVTSRERQARHARTTDDTREDSAEWEEEAAAEPDEVDFAVADYAVYRLVVDLPAAQLNRGVQPLAPSTAKRRIERLAVPRPLRHPTLSPPRGMRTEQDAQDDHLPDEWLRTDF
jgi:type II secretory pathway pseudopilin PulG